MEKTIIKGVYKITNTVTNECYVGSSKNIEKRFKQHKLKSSWKKLPENKLYISMQEYGLEVFRFEIIEECESEKLHEREQYWMETLKPAFNRNRAVLTPEEKSRLVVEYNKKNPEKNRERSRRWREKHLEQHRRQTRECSRIRRAKLKELAGNN